MRSDEPEQGFPLHIRRVVTDHGASGVSRVAYDGAPPVCSAYQHIPGMVTRLVWATSDAQSIAAAAADPTSPTLSHVPGPGETRFIVATFPPDSVFAADSFAPDKAVEENRRLSPGLADRFEVDGFHQTDSIDYAIVLDGEIILELSDQSRTRLTRHDVIVQTATRHAWRNETDRPATIAFVLMGARRGPDLKS
jgi:hypothetical protein